MKLALICAMSENRVIGRNNTLPWRLPEDLKYFKRPTMGSSVIMGRKTWDSIGKVLPGRTNIIVTRSPALKIEGVKIALSVAEAIELAEHTALIDGSEEAFIIGGAELYSEAMPFAERFYLTRVHAEVEGDTFLKSFDEAAWQEISRKEYRKSDVNHLDYSICVLDKKK